MKLAEHRNPLVRRRQIVEACFFIAAKMLKESRYHVRHSGEWMLKLGDGTDESHDRLQSAVNELWRYTGELFLTDDVERRLALQGLAVESASLEPKWRA